jgi:hypothetical protein
VGAVAAMIAILLVIIAQYEYGSKGDVVSGRLPRAVALLIVAEYYTLPLVKLPTVYLMTLTY